MVVKLEHWDSAEYLHDEADLDAYREACAEEGEPALVDYALDVIARARKMNHLASDTSLRHDGSD